MVLYPLSAFRAMSKAVEEVFREIHKADNQQNLLKNMQTRDELYDVLDYHSFENKLDELFKNRLGIEMGEKKLEGAGLRVK